MIRERLDQGIASMFWILAFPKATIQHLGAIKSDLCPILLDTHLADHYSLAPYKPNIFYCATLNSIMN